MREFLIGKLWRVNQLHSQVALNRVDFPKFASRNEKTHWPSWWRIQPRLALVRVRLTPSVNCRAGGQFGQRLVTSNKSQLHFYNLDLMKH